MNAFQEVEMEEAEQCDDPRMTSVHSRFEVLCSFCGAVSHERSKVVAFSVADEHRMRDKDCADTYVYDRMAKRGGPQTFRPVRDGEWVARDYRN